MTPGHAKYEPQWLRLEEAIHRVAKDQIIRLIRDRLRGDADRYAKQDLFRLPGYPMRRTTARTSYDWPAAITDKDINWDASTVYGAHPVRIINVDLLIEISSVALAREFNQKHPGPARGTIDRFGEHDRKLFPKLEDIMRAKQCTVSEAARNLASEISGKGTEDSRIRRLSERYRTENS